MMSPIGLYLPEFTSEIAPLSFDADDVAGLNESAAGQERDLSLELEKARRQGFEEGAASAQEDFAAQAAASEQQYAEHLRVERQQWAGSEGATLADQLQAQLTALEDRIADALVDVLQPFLANATRLKAATELREAIAGLLTNDAGAAIRVSGPVDLLDNLGNIAGVEVLAGEAPEVTLLAGDTVIRSRLQSWAEALAPQPAEARA